MGNIIFENFQKKLIISECLDGKWEMENGKWELGNGKWEMEYVTP